MLLFVDVFVVVLCDGVVDCIDSVVWFYCMMVLFVVVWLYCVMMLCD